MRVMVNYGPTRKNLRLEVIELSLPNFSSILIFIESLWRLMLFSEVVFV